MKNIFGKKGSGIGAQGSAEMGSSDSGQSGIGFWKMIDFSGLKKGISFGLGLISVLATSALLAVAVTGTINTFSSGGVVDASQINTNFASLKTAIQGITSSQWTTNGSSVYYSAGNVGIGTTSPTNTFHISSNFAIIRLSDSTANVDSWLISDATGTILSNSGPYPMVFKTWNSERMRIDFAGNVGIGTSSQTEKLEVVGDIKVGTSGSNGCLKNFGGGTITGTCSSDEKLKKDIQPMESVLDKISQLVPKTYHWRSEEYPNKKFGTQLEYGLVAQDVEKIFPDMVEKDANGLKAIHYERLPILSVQAIKELTFRLGSVTEKLDHEKSVSSDLSLRLGKMTDENARLRERISSLEETVKTRYIVSQNASLELQKLSERLNTLEKMQVVKK